MKYLIWFSPISVILRNSQSRLEILVPFLVTNPLPPPPAATMDTTSLRPVMPLNIFLALHIVLLVITATFVILRISNHKIHERSIFVDDCK